MTIEIVDVRIENGGSFHSYVGLPEGTMGCWVTMAWLGWGDLQCAQGSVKQPLARSLRPSVRTETRLLTLTGNFPGHSESQDMVYLLPIYIYNLQYIYIHIILYIYMYLKFGIILPCPIKKVTKFMKILRCPSPRPSEAPLIVMSTGPQPDALENLEVPENALCVQEVPQALPGTHRDPQGPGRGIDEDEDGCCSTFRKCRSAKVFFASMIWTFVGLTRSYPCQQVLWCAVDSVELWLWLLQKWPSFYVCPNQT